MNDTIKRLLNIIIIFFAFVISYFGIEMIFWGLFSAFTESQMESITKIPSSLNLYIITNYSKAAIVTVISIWIYHKVHLKTLQNFPAEERVLRQRKRAKIIGITLIGLSVLYMILLPKLSTFLYKLNECKGGIGSGISCVGPMESFIYATQMLSFMGSILNLGSIFLSVFFGGLYFLSKYNWKHAVVTFVIFSIFLFT